MILTWFSTTARGQWATSGTNWVAAQRQGDVFYFLLNSPARFARYDAAARTWLASVSLPTARGAATAGGVDADGLYVAYDKACYRYSLTGGGEQFLLNSDVPVTSFHSDQNVLFVNRSSGLYARFTSVNKTTNQVISTFENYVYALGGSCISPLNNRLIGRSTDISPSDITYVTYRDDGTFVTGGDSTYHGSYPSATRTWIYPDESRVVDNSGTIYSADGLVYAGSLGGNADDVTFRGSNLPIVLRGKQLTSYNSLQMPMGSTLLQYPPGRIFLQEPDVLAFRLDAASASGLSVESVSLSSISAPQPGEPVDPTNLPFEIDDLWVERDGNVLLLSKSNASVFRWNPVTQQFATTISLIGVPAFVTYAIDQDALYVAYSSGLIRKRPLTGTTPVEAPFAQLPASPYGMVAAGQYLMVADATSPWITHRTFDAVGTQVSAVDWNYYSSEYVWNAPNQKLYFFRDDTSPNDILWEQWNVNGTTYPSLARGALGEKLDSPYHGDFAVAHPILVEPEGARVVIGSGVAFDATTLQKLASGLPNAIVDGDWAPSALWGLRNASDFVQLQKFNRSSLAAEGSIQWPGVAKKVIALPDDRILAISRRAEGTPSFHVFDTSLGLIAPPTLAKPTGLKLAGQTANSLAFTWTDVNGERGYSVERRTLPSTEWTQLANNGMDVNSFTDASAVLGATYAYRVTAFNETLRSLPSDELQLSISTPAAPERLTITQQGSYPKLSWADLPGELSYTVQRKVGTAGTWNQLTTTSANVVEYLDYGTSAGTRYYYRVAGTNAIGTGSWSAEATFLIPVTPSAPTFYTPAITATSIRLYWGTVNAAEDYELEYKLDSSADWLPLTVQPTGSSSYLHSPVSPQSSYVYRIRAKNEAASSPWATSVTYTTPALPPPPTPSLSSVTRSAAGSLVISWTNVSGETEYVLERQVDSGWLELARLAADVTTYTDPNLTPGVRYDYRVRALAGTLASPNSTVLSAVAGINGCVLDDNFDARLLPAWRQWSGAQIYRSIPGLRDGGALFFGQAGARQASTSPLDVTGGASVKFWFRAGNQAVDGNEYWNDCESGEGVIVEWSLDGSNWTTLSSLDTAAADAKTWREVTMSIPSAAISTSTSFRWRQLSHSGPQFDTWALDDVCVLTSVPLPPTPPLFILAMPSASSTLPSTNLLWPSAERAVVYELERSEDGLKWETLTSTTTTSVIDADTTPSTTYFYRIRARNGGGSSAWSPPSGVTTFTAMQAWRATFVSTPGGAGSADFDTDPSGLTWVMRFAFNMNPGESPRSLDAQQASAGGMPLVVMDATHHCLRVDFLRPAPGVTPDVECAAEFSADGVHWVPAAAEEVTPVNAIREHVTCFDPAGADGGTTRFARVRISRLP